MSLCRWEEKDLNLRRSKPTDLQSAPFVHLGILPVECPRNLYVLS